MAGRRSILYGALSSFSPPSLPPISTFHCLTVGWVRVFSVMWGPMARLSGFPSYQLAANKKSFRMSQAPSLQLATPLLTDISDDVLDQQMHGTKFFLNCNSSRPHYKYLFFNAWNNRKTMISVLIQDLQKLKLPQLEVFYHWLCFLLLA